MKTLKALGLSLLAAALASTAAQAQTTIIHVVGSTAFRAPATAAIIDYLNSTSANGVRAVYKNASSPQPAVPLLGSGVAIFANGTVGAGGSATIIIETSWTGSVAGAVDIAIGGSSSDTFIDVASMDSADLADFNGPVGVVTKGSAATVAYGSETPYSISTTAIADSYTLAHLGGHAPDLTFSDSLNASVAAVYASGAQSGKINGLTQTQILNTISNLVDSGAPGGNAQNAGYIGVLPFEWVVGDITSAGLTQLGYTSTSQLPTNITQQTASALIQGGYISLALLSGTNNSNDLSNFFYLTGRNEDSGTRVEAFSEAQVPFGPVASPYQYQLTGTVTGITAVNLFPANSSLYTETAVTWPSAGHSGYTSGSAVQGALDYPESGSVNGSLTWPSDTADQAKANTGTFFIGYLGITDAVNASNGANAYALTYNGVPYTIANVLNGKYTFWAYEHAYQLPKASVTVQNIDNAIADNVYNNDADIDLSGKHSQASGAPAGDQAAGIFPATLNVSRSTTEGGFVSHN